MKKYGKNIYKKDPVTENKIGIYVCPICRKESTLTKREGCGFKAIFSVCQQGHKAELARQAYPKYHIGDVVRIYDTTFKDDVLKLDCYKEGTIVDIRENITDYVFDMKVTNAITNGEPVPEHSWVYGSLVRGCGHHRKNVKLIKRAKEPVYEQMRLDF